ncbi:uncharacterized protein PFL1_01342 [Pseudozyma flocculosa PF-1]|uniref:Probable putative dioxygenase Ssp1 n=1 Tax=Pseudozyma flocculosa TaxID=84751 RepID=A0A5C3EVR1_9BASI|nr:uncharacterized protein PFL1_01342 [Pseudozyma flocculosa PF-1]EPQ31153.1 hypothetical protein PFL1_01342 [Pseudozyma flocculosa PF-1]SPO36354.1 probable putative dioxygenase Ssp1 [Pseudozyma flocculosa]
MAQIAHYLQDQLQSMAQASTKAPGMAAMNLKELQDRAAVTATTAYQQTAQSMQGPLEQISHLADMVKKNRLVDDAKLVSMIPGAVASVLTGGGLDDRKLLLEQVITILSMLPPDSPVSRTLSNSLIGIIWGDLPHPPVSFMDERSRVRRPDGSHNNFFVPDLGRSSKPYARNVARTQPEPIDVPDVGTVFDLLLARDKFVPHPSGISALLFHFANIIIHDIFATRHENPAINNHSSYLDLQVVYGSDAETMHKARTHQEGLLKPDVISDWRLAMMPPATSALAVLFSRSHNYIAKRLLQVNERNQFDSLEPKELDEKLFNIARLCNCGLFINIILRSYIPAILNTPTSEFFVNPLPDIHNAGQPGKVPRGVGNAVASEFSVLYRWHSTVSMADEKWMDQMFSERMPGKRPDDVTPDDFKRLAAQIKQGYEGKDPSEWNVHDWPRDRDGKYSDDLLAKIIKDATCEVAAAFKARGSPAWFRAVDMLGQIQARETWALCTLNEFRSFLGLKKLESFAEWNNDTDVAKAAEMLYGDIDNLELFPGLLAEEAKPSMTGSGLCPGYTISRAILSDAAALTRGDRFYTLDYSTSTMTTYGLEYANTPQPGSRGSIGKLLMTTLPGQYKYNSTYALYPFMIPSRTIEILRRDGTLDHYDTAYPTPPHRWLTIESYAACKEVLVNERYMTTLPGHGYDEEMMASALFSIPRWKDEVADFYATSMAKAIEANSIRYHTHGKTRMLDLTDVINLVSAQFTATLFALPVQHNGGAVGMSPRELHLALARPLAFDLAGSFSFVGHHSWKLEEQSESATRALMTIVRARVYSLMRLFAPLVAVLQGLSNIVSGPDNLAPGKLAKHFYGQLFATGKRYEEIVNGCFRMMVAMTSCQTLILMRAIQWLVQPDNREIHHRMHSLALRSDPGSAADFRSYILEACRISSETPLPARFAVGPVNVSDGKGNTVQLQAGDGVFIPARAVYRDPKVYDEADAFDPANSSPLTFGLGDRPSQAILDVALPAMAREILKLRNLRLAPSGQPRTVTNRGPSGRDEAISFVSSTGQENPLPLNTAMHILYDEARS